jgi:hypothetical protein
MKTEYTGIDYGLGKSNVDSETGIRYGVIQANEVGQAWYDDSEAEYGNPTCPHCFNDIDETADFAIELGPWVDSDGNVVDSEYFCTICEKGIDDSENIWREDPLGFYYNADDYHAEQNDETDIFIFKSPYFTYAQLCSPCAPGAVYLTNYMDQAEDNPKGYCFGHDWFESGKAPYPVYDVKTGNIV